MWNSLKGGFSLFGDSDDESSTTTVKPEKKKSTGGFGLFDNMSDDEGLQ